MSGLNRILIVNPFGIGDVLFSTPLVRAIRRAFPTAYLAYLCNRRTQQILKHNPNIDELFVYEKDELVDLYRRSKILGARALLSLARRVKRRRFDIGIDLSLGERYSFLFALLGIPQRIGFDFRHRGRFLTHRFAIEGYQGRHVVDYYAWLLGMIGVRMLDCHLDLLTNGHDRQTAKQRLVELGVRDGQSVIGLVPAGGISWGNEAHFRRWPQDGFVQVAKALRDRHRAAILVFGEEKDRQTCAGIAQAIGPGAINLSGSTSLSEFVSLVAQCNLVISNDGGPVHIAASQGVKTVSIFGPVDPAVYGPYPQTSWHRIVSKPDIPCRPCYYQFRLPPCPYERACLSSISTEEVIEACEEVLLETEVAPHACPTS